MLDTVTGSDPDPAGAILLDLTANVGDTVSTPATVLPAGVYTVQFTALASTTSPLSFVARGSGEITMDGFDTLVKAARTGTPPA